LEQIRQLLQELSLFNFQLSQVQQLLLEYLNRKSCHG
jgi:hypothetical protein